MRILSYIIGQPPNPYPSTDLLLTAMHTRIAAFVLLVLLTFALSRCGEPIFPERPFISFKKIGPPIRLSNKDSLVITIFFRDGDGNIGISGEDTVTAYDYFMTGYKRLGVDDQGNPNFVPVEFPTTGIDFNGRIPVLKPDGQPGPIEGDLDYSIPIDFPQDFSNERYILPGDTLKFEIHIFDRSGNKSNTVETTEVVVLKR